MNREYKNIRITLMKLHHEILKFITLEQFQIGASKLGIYKNKQIELKNRTEEEYFYDFNIYEEAKDETRIINQFIKRYIPKSTIESNLIHSLENSFTSLFIIKAVNPDKDQIILEDIISKRLIPLTDINFSKFYLPRNIIYTRLIKYNNYYFTSGMAMIFEFKYHKDLLKIWQKSSLLEDDNTHRFINLFHYHRLKGILIKTQTINKNS